MILDTNALSAWWEGNPAIRTAISEAPQVCIPVPALAEFRFGILQSKIKVAMTAWIEQALATSKVLDVTDSTTRHYAEIRLQLKQRGTPIPMNDLWIAAIALQHQLPLLSRDTHFDVVENITRISW